MSKFDRILSQDTNRESPAPEKKLYIVEPIDRVRKFFLHAQFEILDHHMAKISQIIGVSKVTRIGKYELEIWFALMGDRKIYMGRLLEYIYKMVDETKPIGERPTTTNCDRIDDERRHISKFEAAEILEIWNPKPEVKPIEQTEAEDEDSMDEDPFSSLELPVRRPVLFNMPTVAPRETPEEARARRARMRARFPEDAPELNRIAEEDDEEDSSIGGMPPIRRR